MTPVAEMKAKKGLAKKQAKGLVEREAAIQPCSSATS